jgi:hypothetical protein
VHLRNGSYREYGEWDPVSLLVGLEHIHRIEEITAGEPQYGGPAAPAVTAFLLLNVGMAALMFLLFLVRNEQRPPQPEPTPLEQQQTPRISPRPEEGRQQPQKGRK